MSDEIRLREHSTAHVSLSLTQVAFLRAALRERIEILSTGEQGRYELKSGSHVGFVMLPEGGKLILEPKVQIDTLFTLLARVYDPTREIFRDAPQTYSSVQELFEFVVRVFATHVEELIARGIVRGYRPIRENVNAIRGKLLLAETLRHRPGIFDQHTCRFSEFTADIPENQILHATAFALQPYPYREQTLAARLRRVALTLGDAQYDGDALQLFQRLTFHRLNEPYRPALALARFLLEQLAFSGSTGNQTFLSYLIDMNWLFEAYVIAVVETMARRWGMSLRAQEIHALDAGHKIEIRPDMILYAPHAPCLVLDAKYKLAAQQHDIYQVIAYCHALNVEHAVLIHPTNEQAPTGTVTVKGQPPLLVSYLALDLGGNPAQLEVHTQELENSLARLLAA